MTDSEKMDLILSKLTNFNERFDKIELEMQDMKSEIQSMKTKIDKLSLGQLEIQKEIYIINRRISDTYNVALDALVQHFFDAHILSRLFLTSIFPVKCFSC